MNIYTIDAETDPFDGTTNIKPFVWDIYNGTKHHTVDTVRECHNFIKDHKGIYFAHNGGRFDYHLSGFCDEIESGTQILAINGRLVRFKMLGSEFRDSFTILPAALSDIGGKKEIDYAKLHRDKRKAHMQEIIEYLHADTEALFKAVSAFRAEYSSGITLAGTAIKELEKRLPPGKPIPKLTLGADQTLRPFYFGGRVQAFVKGEINKPFKVYDINSAYPTAMCDKHGWSPRLDVCEPKSTSPICPQSFYEFEGESQGALPLISKKGLDFPYSAGLFRCTGWELIAGLETGTVKVTRFKRRIDFAHTVDFKPYVKHFGRLKQEAAKGSHQRLFAKLFLNSAYGKLGCDPTKYSNYVVCNTEEMAVLLGTGFYEKCGEIGNKWIVSKPLELHEQRRLHVGCAASITGWVRAHLWREQCAVKKRGGKILYCDTDSLTVQGCTVPTGKELGDWTLDADCASGGIAGKKLYAFKTVEGEWKVSSKGARLTAQQVLACCRGQVVQWDSLAPTFSFKGVSMLKRKMRRT